MPAVKIEWYAGRSNEVKAKIAKAIADAIVTVQEAKVLRENVMVFYNDYKKEDLYLIGDPFRVLINWFKGRSTEVKGKVAKAITDGVAAVAGANIKPENVTVSFSDAKFADFFKAGKPLK